MIIQEIRRFGQREPVPKLPDSQKMSNLPFTHCLLDGETDRPIVQVAPSLKKDETWAKDGKGAIGGKYSTIDKTFVSGYFEGRCQGEGAPVCDLASSEFAAGYMRLMKSGSPHNKCYNNFWMVFWTDRPTKFETLFLPSIFGSSKIDSDELRAFRDECIYGDSPEWKAEFSETAYLFVTHKMDGRASPIMFDTLTVGEMVDRYRLWNRVNGIRISDVLANRDDKMPSKWFFNLPYLVDFACGAKHLIYQLIEDNIDPEKTVLDKSNRDTNYIAGRRIAFLDHARRVLDITTPSLLEANFISQTDVDGAEAQILNLIRRIGKKKFSNLKATLEKSMPTASGLIDTTDIGQAMLRLGHAHQMKYLERFNFSFATITERGELVRSKGEKAVADILFKHGVSYGYEIPMRLEGDLGYPRLPDFTIPTKDGSFVIEFLGSAHRKDSDPAWERKQELYSHNSVRYAVIDDRDGRMTSAEIAEATSGILTANGLV